MARQLSEATKLERAARKARCAARIQEAAASADIPPKALAKLVGVSSQSVYDWLAGRKIPRYDEEWSKLADALGCSEMWLRGYKTGKRPARKRADAPPFDSTAERATTQGNSRDGLPSESVSICFHSTRDIYDRIVKMAEEDGITLRAELTRCMKAYFESIDNTPPSSSDCSVVAIALGEDDLRSLDAVCGRTGEDRSSAAKRLFCQALQVALLWLRAPQCKEAGE